MRGGPGTLGYDAMCIFSLLLGGKGRGNYGGCIFLRGGVIGERVMNCHLFPFEEVRWKDMGLCVYLVFCLGGGRGNYGMCIFLRDGVIGERVMNCHLFPLQLSYTILDWVYKG